MADGEFLHGSDPQASALLKALGIPEPESVSRIVLDVAAGNVATVYIQRFLSKVQVEAVLMILQTKPVKQIEVTEKQA